MVVVSGTADVTESVTTEEYLERSTVSEYTKRSVPDMVDDMRCGCPETDVVTTRFEKGIADSTHTFPAFPAPRVVVSDLVKVETKLPICVVVMPARVLGGRGFPPEVVAGATVEPATGIGVGDTVAPPGLGAAVGGGVWGGIVGCTGLGAYDG